MTFSKSVLIDVRRKEYDVERHMQVIDGLVCAIERTYQKIEMNIDDGVSSMKIDGKQRSIYSPSFLKTCEAHMLLEKRYKQEMKNYLLTENTFITPFNYDNIAQYIFDEIGDFLELINELPYQVKERRLGEFSQFITLKETEIPVRKYRRE